MSIEDEVLELDTRRKIYEEVRKFPGLHLRELARQMNMSVTLVDYHLGYLEKNGLVSGIMDAQFKRFYPRDPAGTGIRTDFLSIEDKRVLPLLRQRIPLQIVLLLLKEGKVRHRDMIPQMGVSPSTLSHHLAKLLRRGVVQKVEDGYTLTDAAATLRLLLKVEPAPGTLSDSFARLWDEMKI